MKVRLLDIDEKPSLFAFQVKRNELEKLEKRFDFKTLECEARLIRSMDFVELRGAYKVRIDTECDFCLEPVALDLDESFTLDLVAEGNQQDLDGDVELSMDSPEIDFYSGEEINLIPYFEDQLVLDLPYNISCSDDCRGLCSTCGGNLNKNRCDCHKNEGNSPFAVLKDLLPDS